MPAGIVTYIAIPQSAFSGKDKDFTVLNFKYNEKDDNYTCSNNQTLTTNGKYYDKKNRRGVFILKFKRHNMSPATCAACPFADKCLSKTAEKYHISRQLERPENQQAVIDNKKKWFPARGRNSIKNVKPLSSILSALPKDNGILLTLY